MAGSLPLTAKKHLWELLTDNGRADYAPALSTFYAHCRKVGIEAVWRDAFAVRNFPRIASVLAIHDREFEVRLSRVHQLRSQIERTEEALRLSGFS